MREILHKGGVMGIKTILHNRIKELDGKIMPLNEVHYLCNIFNYKHSTAERKLRPSESPNVVPILNGKKHIMGYRLKKD